MSLFLSVLAGVARALLWSLEICMLIRAVLSWFPLRDDNPFLLFVCMVTEPLILPFRRLFEKLNWFQDLPIDIAFFAGYLVLVFAQMLLGLAL